MGSFVGLPVSTVMTVVVDSNYFSPVWVYVSVVGVYAVVIVRKRHMRCSSAASS